MIKNKKTKIALLVIFLIIEMALFFAVQITSGEENDIYMMSVVILACLFMLTSFEKTKQYALMQVGLLCTVLADVFLVIMDPEIEIPAMIFFSVTQICYFLRLYFDDENEKRNQGMNPWFLFWLPLLGSNQRQPGLTHKSRCDL